jgi:spermidine synthase
MPQWETPQIALVESQPGELTLSIDGEQAMQAWERDLMWAAADMLCANGSEFLEVGLGLGLSALRIATHPNTRRHVVVERYARVIELFRERHPSVPPTLEIVHADLFEHFETVQPESLDGVFFDPFMPASLENQQEIWDEFMPSVIAAMRRGASFIPFFTTEPVLKWPFYEYFERIVIQTHPFAAYPGTNYTTKPDGVAYIQAFIKV